MGRRGKEGGGEREGEEGLRPCLGIEVWGTRVYGFVGYQGYGGVPAYRGTKVVRGLASPYISAPAQLSKPAHGPVHFRFPPVI